MRILANKEVYRLDIKIGVSGDSEANTKLTATEKMVDQAKKKMQTLDKIKASPTAKLNDQATNKLAKLGTTIKRIDNSNITTTLRLKDQASSYLNKVQSKSDKLKNTNINPTAKVTDQASDKLKKIKTNEENLKDKKIKIQAQDEASRTLNKIEGKINGWIKAGAKKVIALGTAGVLAAGGLGIGTSIKTYSEYEKGLSNVKAVTNATDKQMQQLDTTAKTLGSTTAWSARHVTQAEELLGQAGFSVEETITALPGLLNLASAGDLDLAAATDIASGTLRAFNLNADQSSHVADVLALSASATNSDVTDLGETMKYVAPVSQALGISLEDTAAASGLLSNANIKGSQAGTVLRQTIARLASPTSEAAKVMQNYGVNVFDAYGNMKPLGSVVDNLNSSLSKLTSQQRADVIATIFGTESMSGVLALMNQGGKSVSDLSKQLKDANGASQKMADTKLDNLNGQWIELKSAVEHMQITLGEKLTPYAKEFVTWLTGKMPAITEEIVTIVDYLSKHTDDIKSLTMTVIGLGTAFTGLSAIGALGNTLTGIASLTSVLKGAGVAGETASIAGGLSNIGVIGKLLPAIFNPAGLAIAASIALIGTAIVANNDLMKKSITTTVEELGPVEKIMNKLNGNLNKSKKEMVTLGLIYDDFGEGISDNFKTSTESASKSLLSLEMNLKRLTIDNNFSESDNNSLKNWVNDFAYEGINAMRQKQSEIRSEFEKTFSIDGVISTSEQGVLDYLGSYFEEGVNKELSIRDEIYKIGDQAIKDHGAILDGDMQQIKEKLAELQAIKLEYVNAENAKEQAYAKSKFASAAERVTSVDGASELLQEKAKEHQNSVDETKANFEGTTAATKVLMNNETDPVQKEILRKGLEETEKARDEALKQADENWQSDLATLYEVYPNAKGLLNEDNGAKFTNSEIKSQGKQKKIEDSHSGLENITESGIYALQNDTTKNLDTLYVSVDEKAGKIKGLLNGTTGEIGAYSDEQKKALEEVQEKYVTTGSAMQQLVDKQVRFSTSTGNVVSGAGDMVGALEDICIATDGTTTGILNLNGTPIQITSNASGEITTMRVFKGSIDNIPPNADVQIDTNANQATSDMNGTTNAINSMPDKKTVTITTIFKKITKWFEEKFSGSSNSISNVGMDYGAQEGSRFIDQNADGTSFSNTGLTTVNERGWELTNSKTTPIIGRYNNEQLAYTSKGTKILNHMQSVNDMKDEVSRQVDSKLTNQPQQIQYKLVQPQQQVKVAGSGGVSFGDINVNVDGNQDIDTIIAQATQEVGRKLKEAFTNIKK